MSDNGSINDIFPDIGTFKKLAPYGFMMGLSLFACIYERSFSYLAFFLFFMWAPVVDYVITAERNKSIEWKNKIDLEMMDIEAIMWKFNSRGK